MTAETNPGDDTDLRRAVLASDRHDAADESAGTVEDMLCSAHGNRGSVRRRIVRAPPTCACVRTAVRTSRALPRSWRGSERTAAGDVDGTLADGHGERSR